MKYNPLKYKSPQRVWDVINLEYLDLWRYEHEFDLTLDDGRQIKVVPVFEYDNGSIPALFSNWLRRDEGQGVIAFLIHDWLYEKQQIEGEWITRKEADKILYKLLRHAGMRYTKAKAVYLGVRMGGWTFYNKRAKALGNIHYV
jgi:hypothetical protein